MICINRPEFLRFACAFALIPGLFAADPNYAALRNDTVAGSYHVSNLVLKRDAGTFTFQTGAFSFGHSILGKRVFAVFSGDASFHLAPLSAMDGDYLRIRTGNREFDETFHSAVFCFTDGTDDEVMKAAQAADDSPARAAGLFHDFRNLVRDHDEAPHSQVQALFWGEDADNIDAELLRELYTPGHASFSAYIHGQKNPDLRFIVNPEGAIPQLRSPEEVALINGDQNADAGLLYMGHLLTEWQKHTASSLENHRWVQAESYKIDTTIASHDHVTAAAVLRMKVLTEGTRVVKFGLLPNLRVDSVKYAGNDIPFIQESRKQDGSFYLIFPEPMKAGTDAEITIAYNGNEVIHKEGGGTYAVGARESWYPSLNSFTDRALYDLTFHTSKQYTLVSVGKPDKPIVKDGVATSHWVSEAPLPVAGFNYGAFKKLTRVDEATNYQLEVYATTEPPDYLAQSGILLDPAAMSKSAMTDTQNSLRVFETWFGKLPYSRVAVTEQPEFNFGQSWPTLVYLPVSAFLDSTQRHHLLGASSFKFGDFIDEVTAHEVSHQWWGHEVGWATYHDQWLSEGFADFSASLFMEATMSRADVLKYWDRQRSRILDKNEYGARANDAGPLWLGERLDWKKNENAYNSLVYSKGAYVLEMLRMLLWNAQNGDKAFQDMMHEFAAAGGNPSTESFAAIAAKHMPANLDVARDKTLNWFFREWVYDTEIPRYAFEYSVKPAEGGKFTLSGKLTQSEVADNFFMSVPLYVENQNKQLVRLAMIPVAGNSARTFSLTLPFKPAHVGANLLHEILASDTANKEVQ
jgi:hypothetical protein